MQHTTKAFSVDFKSLDDDQGEFSALAAVFNNVDRVGDRILAGAFKKSIKEWESGSKPLPIVFAHNIENPMMFIGEVKAMRETEHGLVVKGSLHTDTNEYARQAYALLKSGTISDFSFQYDANGQLGEDGAYELTDIKLYEVGPCLVGANPEAGLLAVKSAVDAIRDAAPQKKPEATEPDPALADLRRLYTESLLDF
jgi:HK97 family phage prohead protease